MNENYPIPDPAWDYATLWDYLEEMEDKLKALRATMSEVEAPTRDSDLEIRDRFLEIQAVCFEALGSLKPEDS